MFASQKQCSPTYSQSWVFQCFIPKSHSLLITTSQSGLHTKLIFRHIALYCRFSLSHHHQNHSINNIKNQRGKRRWTFKESRKNSGLCDFSCGRYSKNCCTQIYKDMYGDAMFVSLWGAQIWRPEANKDRCLRVCYQKPVVVFWGLINFYMSTYSHTGTVFRLRNFSR